MTKAIKKISDLKPDSHNANKGTERGQYMIEASLRKVGAGRSIVVDRDGRIIAGNKTLENWSNIADSDDIEVIQTDGKKLVVVQRTDLDLDDADNTTARELAYYDNRSSQVSLDWDAEVLLADLAAEVPLNDFFRDDELDEILKDIDAGQTPGADTEPEISRADELQAIWGTELGQLWQCGPHRVICGDCTDRDVVDRLFDAKVADMVFTDPPYGVNYEGGTGSYSGGAIKSKTRSAIDGDLTADLYVSVFENVNRTMGDGPIYIWYADKLSCGVFGSIPSNVEIRRIINWYKISQGFGDMGSDYHCVSEPCLYLVKGKSNYIGPNNEKSVWEIQRPQVNEFHPTQKPVELAERAIGNHDAKTVADFFLGSGTTMIAAHNLNRICYGCEISPGYVAVILQRFKGHTGIEPVLIS